VLAALHRSEHEGKPSLRLTDLGEQLIIRPPSVTMMVDRLERLGLVRRETSKSDSRAKEVELTEAGRQLVERVLAAHRAQMDRVFGSLSAAEQAEIKRLLDKISGNLEVMERGLNRSDNGGYPR
jgi:DNA-binding MarR family transcriptional regulator